MSISPFGIARIHILALQEFGHKFRGHRLFIGQAGGMTRCPQADQPAEFCYFFFGHCDTRLKTKLPKARFNDSTIFLWIVDFEISQHHSVKTIFRPSQSLRWTVQPFEINIEQLCAPVRPFARILWIRNKRNLFVWPAACFRERKMPSDQIVKREMANNAAAGITPC